MPFTKDDLKKIDNLVKTSAMTVNARMDDAIKASADSINSRMDKSIKTSADSIKGRIDSDLKSIDLMMKANIDIVSARIDKLEENMNHRFDENDRQHGVINAKLDRVIKTENEDIAAAYEDIDSIKLRLKKANL